jgi:hypothetical protein
MLVSWFTPWWGAKVSDLLGDNHMVMHPWGVEAVEIVAAYVDRSMISMPAFFAPLMWAYLGLCMVALAAALFVEKGIALGRFNLSLAQVLIGLVGLSYLIATVTALIVAQTKSADAGVQFIGATVVYNPQTGGNTTMTGALGLGYWLAIAAAVLLIALALLRNVITGRPTA